MTLLQVIILGIVEGISEFLPISSTGHLILAAQALNIPQTEFVKTFEIAIQLGAVCAVILLYWRKLFTDRETIKRVLAAFIPTAVLGLIAYKSIKQYLLGNSLVVVWALLLGGIFLIIFEQWKNKKSHPIEGTTNIPYRHALLIGLFQACAFIPGVSRAAATIIGGLWLGIERKTIVEMSFLLAVPTMVAATGLDLYKNAASFSVHQTGELAIGFFVSMIVAACSIKFLMRFIKTHNFTGFGIYRILLALVFFVLQ